MNMLPHTDTEDRGNTDKGDQSESVSCVVVEGFSAHDDERAQWTVST